MTSSASELQQPTSADSADSADTADTASTASTAARSCVPGDTRVTEILTAPAVVEGTEASEVSEVSRGLEPGLSRTSGASSLAATSLVLISLLLLGFAGFTLGVSHVLHARAQSLHYADLREQLANGIAPVGPLDHRGAPLAEGAPVALIELPTIGLREVVLEGTTSGVLRDGPGHRRDTVLPGQAGTAVVFGRRAAFGGPFGDVPELRRGTELTVTTGQGRFTYRVTGRRSGGDPAPPPPAPGAGRLTLVTALGPPYLPTQAVRVDADLVGDAAPAPLRPAVPLRAAEGALAGDPAAGTDLLLWSQALLLAVGAVTWLTFRWGRRQAWLVGVPVLALLGVAVSASAVRLLPNLL